MNKTYRYMVYCRYYLYRFRGITVFDQIRRYLSFFDQTKKFNVHFILYIIHIISLKKHYIYNL